MRKSIYVGVDLHVRLDYEVVLMTKERNRLTNETSSITSDRLSINCRLI